MCNHFLNKKFVSVKYCFKNSLLSDHCLNFLSSSDHILGQKSDIFLIWFLFLVSDNPAWSHVIARNSLLKCQRSPSTEDVQEDIEVSPYAAIDNGTDAYHSLDPTDPNWRDPRKDYCNSHKRQDRNKDWFRQGWRQWWRSFTNPSSANSKKSIQTLISDCWVRRLSRLWRVVLGNDKSVPPKEAFKCKRVVVSSI